MGRVKGVWDSDSDDDGGLEEGMSPPKTMQFHIPRERLLRTPGMFSSSSSPSILSSLTRL